MFLLWWEPHSAQVPIPALAIVSLDAASNPLTGLKKGNLEDMSLFMRIQHFISNLSSHDDQL